ncbi:IS3 family transposase [Paenibacillus albiflavus]|uniref:IS3 family transposase n=1 Tax=Paenibacillus albiflavus TaxID=2545760 RepID=UPI0022A85263|nr:IS3 family transposase [Paenibacillus albiflavus]
MKQGNPATLVLRIIGLAESTYYARIKRAKQPKEHKQTARKGRPCPGYSLTISGVQIDDEQIKKWLLELLEGEEHIYGYRCLAQCLRNKYGLSLNPKKCYRLCKELEILQQQRKKKINYPRRLPVNRMVTGSNQLWQMDIKYGRVVARNRFFFILSIIDIFDRVIVGYYVGTTCEAKHAVQVLGKALQDRIQPGEPLPTIRTDNGPQFVSALFEDMCTAWGVVHERIPPKTPDLNAYIESFHSLVERNLFAMEIFMTLEQAYEAMDRYMDFYNNRRLHGSLKRMPPAKFSKWILEQEDRTKFYRAL